MQSSLVVRRADGARTEALSEDLSPTQNCVAAGAAGNHHELNDTPRQRQIGRTAPITAMHTPGNRPARWAKTKAAGRSYGDNDLVSLVERTFHNKPGRHQTGAAKCLLHGADSLKKARDCIKTESEPNLDAD
jgi:hypothetical protein